MIQRLLRGRALYISLALLVVGLYARHVPPSPFESRRVEISQGDETQEWWPAQLNQETLEHVARQQPHLALALTIVTGFMLVMSVGGIGLAGWGLWSGRIRSAWRFPTLPLPRWTFGELGRIVALTLAMAALLPFAHLAMLSMQPSGEPDHHLWITVSMCALDVFIALAILAFAGGKGRSAWRSLGFSRKRVLRSIGVGFRAYVAVFPWIFLLLFLIVEAARQFGLKPPIEPIQELVFQEDRPAVLALTVLLACLIGPVTEELLFRGVVYPVIRHRTSRLIAMLVSGGLFALVHTNLLGFLPIMLLGCVLAYLYERTGSLASPLAVHILHNTFLMSLALVFRRLLELG